MEFNMARHGISYQQVANAASELVENGKTPTHEHIRQLIGSGSNNTISKYLRQWKANQNINSLTAVKENLPDELTQVIKNLWERVVEQAEEKLMEIERNYTQQISDLNLQYEKYKSNNRRWQHLSQNWIKEKENLIAEKNRIETLLTQAEKVNAQLHAKTENLAQQIADKQEQLNIFERLFKKLNVDYGETV
jgi:DNA repair exonuclease SbcCD ATPase subunit